MADVVWEGTSNLTWSPSDLEAPSHVTVIAPQDLVESSPLPPWSTSRSHKQKKPSSRWNEDVGFRVQPLRSAKNKRISPEATATDVFLISTL